VPRIDWALPVFTTPGPGAVEGVCCGAIEGSTAGLPVGVVVVVVSLPEPTGRSDPLVVSLLDPLDPLLLLPLLPLDPLEPDEDDFGFFTVSACVFVTSATSLLALGSSPLARAVNVTLPLVTFDGIATDMETWRVPERVAVL
jgi:hypothetical protein